MAGRDSRRSAPVACFLLLLCVHTALDAALPAVALAAPRKRKRSAPPPPPPVAPAPAPTPLPPAPEPPQCPPCKEDKKDDGGDVVETIDETGASSGPKPLAPAPVAGAAAGKADAEKLQARGFARLHGAVGYAREGFHPDRPDPLSPPFDVLAAGAQLYLALGYARGRAFEAVVSGQAIYGVFEQDARIAEAWNGFNGFATRTSFEGLLREAFVRVGTGPFDLRVGQQRIAWGRSDGFAPNDILDARDLRDPFLSELELTHLPNFAVRADADFGWGSLQLVGHPFFQPNRADTYGSNWSIVQPDAPGPYRGLVNLAERMTDRTLHDQIQPLLGQSQVPDRDFSSISPGVRFAWTAGGVDVSHYYQYGYDHTPRLRIDPMFGQLIGMVDFAALTPEQLTAITTPFVVGPRPVTSEYLRRHHVGLDVQAVAGPMTLRLDAAYDSALVLYRRDLQGLAAPVVQAVAGAEYSGGESGKVVNLEVAYVRVLDPIAPASLLFYEANTFGVAGVMRWTFVGRLELQLRGTASLQPVGYSLQPQISWRLGDVWLRLGGVLLGGDLGSYGHYYRRNQAVYAMVKVDL